MIELYQWPSFGQLPNLGPFCLKLEAYLRITKTPHRVHSTRSLKRSPKRTMPYIEMGGEWLSDSKLIIDKLERMSAEPLNSHLKPEDRAKIPAYRALCEDRLGGILIHFRWYEDDGWDQFSRILFQKAPAMVRVLVGGRLRQGTKKRLFSNGISRHSREEITQFAREDVASLAALLGDKKFVFGDRISTLDLSLFGVLGNALYGGIDIPLVEIVKSHPNLVQHIDSVMQLAYGRSLTKS